MPLNGVCHRLKAIMSSEFDVVEKRQERSSHCQLQPILEDKLLNTSSLKLVEAAGVEPASEIAVSRENPCSVRFRMFSPQTLRTDKMRLKLVR